MKKLLLFFLIFTIFFLNVFSQKAPLKWKKLTKEEIDLKVYNNNPSIPAVILYDYGQMYFDLNPNGGNLFLFRKRHVRMKILNKAGLKYAKVKFVYDDMNCEYLSGELSFSIRAITHNVLENGKIKTTKLKYKNIKHTDSTNCLKIAEFEFPDVKVGSILEYEVIIPTLKLIKPDSWYFQNKLPVIYSEFRAQIPSDFSYIFSVKNITNLPVKTSTYFDKVINGYTYNGKHYNYVFNMSGTEYRFVNKYMPVIKNKKEAEKINIHLQYIKSKQYDEDWTRISKALMVTTMPDYDSKTPNQRRAIDYPSGYIIYYLPTWKELNKKLLECDKFGLALIKHWDCDSILNSITNEKQSELEKVKAIYYFVKNNMEWNKEYSIYADVSDSFIKKVYSKMGAKVDFNSVGNYFKKGRGSSSEINFVLMYLLNKANIEVYPVLANLFDNEVIDKNISDINQFKTVIALVNIGDKEYLLDAVLPESSFLEISPQYDKNQMFVVKKDGFRWFNGE